MEYVLTIIGLPQFALKRAFAPLGYFVEHIFDHFIPHHRNNYHPHILGHRSLALISALLIVVKIFIISVISFGPILPAFSSAITQENIINLTNQSRIEYGLNNLKHNEFLQKAAQAKAEDMLARGYFAHNSPDGRTPWSFIVEAGYNYIMAGENLAVNFNEAENVEEAWMNSPGHKANILNKDFEEIGIGIAEGMYQGHNAIFVVQEFGTPVQQKMQLAEKPTQVQQEFVPAPARSENLTTPVEQQVLPEFKNDKIAEVKDSSIILEQEKNILQPEILKIENGLVTPVGDSVEISATVTGPATKVMVMFGEKAVMLEAKNNNLWVGQIKTSELTEINRTVRIKALDINNKSTELQLADFSSGTIANYNLNNTAPSSKVSFLGFNFDPKNFETQVYLYIMAVLLATMVLAIAIKKHVQHLNLIANGSFVVMFASLMYMLR